MSLLKPLKIANLTIDFPAILAPMAGITHSPFRNLILLYQKPGLFFSEMLSSKSVLYEDFSQSIYLRCIDSVRERPIAYQIFASDEESAFLAAKRLNKEEYIDIIDFNLSCPAPEIAKKRKAGAFLLSDLDLAFKILKAVKRGLTKPFTVKVRIGMKEDRELLKDLISMVEEAGADAITVHPRLVKQKLKGKSKWEYIAFVKEIAGIPVIGNGDVKTREDFFRMLEETGCDGVMIGRAAVQKPWIFGEISEKEYEITPDFLINLYQRMLELYKEFFPPEKALGRIKEFTWYFSKNLKFGHHFASKVQSSKSVNEILNFFKDYIKSCF
ncbi:tRNA-dihydrouridine synthase B [Thermotomaculum hydrothermale]|uniref:tRNA-dihydrouridine synthase n=1 Tax=Thermotomaculum hydrothermale TaxID=981385 RepID=A0A7R6SY15_9BACT|nr:tRNA-dihydrouridine synthase family protein [Thermotomaculum hydrothermale]BBB32155.1 tRNA-dihydrouridine synthase B [Thermotomaculum hydrothermale]